MAYTTINKSTDYFNTILYTGDGTTKTISGVGFQPDMVWGKGRNSSSSHSVVDAVRGATKSVFPNTTAVEDTNSTSYLTAFTSDGYSVNSSSNFNVNSRTQVNWNWKANGQGSSNTDGSINTTYTSVNTTAGFSISKYVGNDTAGATVGHGLGAVPEMMIVKRLSGSAQHWSIYHKDIGNTHYMQFDTNAKLDDAGVWYDTSPTSTVFTIGNSSKVNGGGGSDSYIAYCFTPKTGYSKFGSYVGNNNNDGSFIYTGFAPSFVMVKNTQTARDWMMFDNKRTDGNPNLVNKYLIANGTDTEGSNSTTGVDFLSNGFKCRNTFGSVNHAETYIYMAFASAPLVGSNNIPATAR
jgi:hypothetical protein